MRRLRELAEDLRFLLVRAVRRLPGSPRAGGRRLRRLWFGRSLAFRRRSAAIVGVVAIYAALKLAAPGMPCGLPGGECPPRDDAIALVPAGAYAYAHAWLGDDVTQFKQARELADRLPNFPAIAQGLFRELGPGRDLELGSDVFPWLADEIAAAVLPEANGESQWLVLLAVRSKDDARQLAARIGGKESAVLNGFLVLGTETAVHDAVDASRGRIPSLDDSPEAGEMRAELPEERLADAYVSPTGADSLLSEADGPAVLDAFADLDASEGAAAAVIAEDEGLRVELNARRDPVTVRRDPGLFTPRPRFDPDVADEFPADTLALLAIGDHTGEVRRAIAEAIPPGFYNAYEGSGDRLVVSTSRRGNRRAIESEGDLTGSDSYGTVLADSPQSVSALVFFNLSGLVRLVATRGLAEIVSGFQADLTKLRALGVTVDAGEDSLHTRLFLEIE